MKRTPIKGKLDNFFSSLGKEATSARQTKQKASNTGEYAGMTNFEKRRAEKKSRKAGESKFQADNRRRGEKKKPKNQSDISVDTQIEAADKQFGKGVQVTAKKSNPSQTFKQAFAAARKANKKTFTYKGKSYTTELA